MSVCVCVCMSMCGGFDPLGRRRSQQARCPVEELAVGGPQALVRPHIWHSSSGTMQRECRHYETGFSGKGKRNLCTREMQGHIGIVAAILEFRDTP